MHPFDETLSFTYSNATVQQHLQGLNGQYFTRKYPGLFVFAADINNVDRFSINGYLGADGAGQVAGAELTVNYGGTIYKGVVKRVHSVGDPSVNHLIIVEQDAATTHQFSSNTNDDFHSVENINSSRLYYLLYASSSGGYIDDAETLQIMDKFLELLDQKSWISLGLVLVMSQLDLPKKSMCCLMQQG